MRRSWFYIIITAVVIFLLGFKKITIHSGFVGKIDPPFADYETAWSDSIFSRMTLDEKIGQLFMIAAYPSKGKTHWKQIGDLIEKYNIGGIIVFQGSPHETAQMINYLQRRAKVPLLVAIDAEWGLGMRLDSTIKFPFQIMLGAIDDNALIYQMGEEIANELKRIGIQVNFAPVADINNNAANPVIGVRSFGENKNNVAQKALAYALGMQSAGVIAVGKHFPGHGDTDKDSHKTLPIINVSAERLDTLELYPFKTLIANGLTGIMTAHLYIPSIISETNLPSTLSAEVIDSILTKKLGFKGLIFTDAMTMKGVSDYFPSGEAELRALMAGNDILLMPRSIADGFNAIKTALKRKKISVDLINFKVRKILKAKAWVGLNNYQPTDLQNLTEDLNNDNAILLKRRLIEAALTLVKNKDSLIPIKNLANVKIAAVSVGDGRKTVFQDFLLRYADVKMFNIDKNASYQEFQNLKARLKEFDYVIIGVHNTKPFAVKTFGITRQTVNFIQETAKQNKVILDLFASPYSLRRIGDTKNIEAILISYQDDPVIEELSAQLIFGGIAARGKLPVSVGEFKAGTQKKTKKIRLKYSVPAELNIDKSKLEKIDSLIQWAIDDGAMPGCQILAAKDGIVFFQKSYGYFTYDEMQPVNWYNLYDIASVTKVVATTAALMKLYEQGKFDVYKTLGYYLPELKGTNKYNLRIIDVLTHQARLRRWIPFFWHTIDHKSNMPKPEYYRFAKTKGFTTQVAENLYIRDDFKDEIYEKIAQSSLYRYKRYRYSDLGFYLLKKIVEKQTNQTLDSFVTETFYKPLGAWSVRYNPLKYFPKSMIVPSAIDETFRHQMLQGYVHDYGAALLGGVGGHAGLFANANDLAKFFQMLLNGGTYGGVKFFEKQTVRFFTRKPFYNNRRALGFDSKNGRNKSPACGLASTESFGHLGFTGCMVWADPKYDFIFVFLSNRTFPNDKNRKLIDLNVRQKVQSLLYQSFLYSHYSK